MKYKGMTVNEALYESGLIDDFDKAVKEKNAEKVASILRKLDLNMDSINPILQHYNLQLSNNLEEE